MIRPFAQYTSLIGTLINRICKRQATAFLLLFFFFFFFFFFGQVMRRAKQEHSYDNWNVQGKTQHGKTA